jgi:hypothetical protein
LRGAADTGFAPGGAGARCQPSAGRGRNDREGIRARLTALTEAALTVRWSDGTDFTCDVQGLDLSAFPVGTQVKLHCHRLDGQFRLGFIKSD